MHKPRTAAAAAPTDLHFLSIAQAAALIETKALSPVEYVRELIARIDALDDQVRAFVTRTDDIGIEQARAAEREIARGEYSGPLHGIPFALKDIYNTAGVLTSAHSKIAMGNVPHENATATQRMLDCGAVMLGKLATHEFASGGPSLDLPWPPARNPWNTAHFTGSSSSGSGAAIAAGFCPASLGSDTGGSIRIPASLCGVAGLKPTYGRVSRYGVIPNSFTFDHAGPLAWTVEDCAILLQCVAGHDARDPTSSRRPVPEYRKALTRDIRGLRIGVVRHFWEEEGNTAPEAAHAMDAAIDVLKRLGARIGVARMRSRQDYNDVKMVIAKTELVVIHEKDMRERLQDYGADFIGRNLPGFLFTAADYVRAQRERKRMVDEMEPLYDAFDVLLTASSAPAARLDELIGSGFADKWEKPNIYTPFNVTGGPALSVCNGYTEEGLPLSMQIAGRPFYEETVLRVGHAYECATEWRTRRPALVAGTAAPQLTAPANERLSDQHVSSTTRATVEAAIARAGLKLSNAQRALLYRVAPTVLAAVRRIPGDRPWSDEPANAFFFRES
ncbi:MAG TPA: amidase [Burkholderiales bacterium]|nr:amidase [Burkholderiales bacterium]